MHYSVVNFPKNMQTYSAWHVILQIKCYVFPKISLYTWDLVALCIKEIIILENIAFLLCISSQNFRAKPPFTVDWSIFVLLGVSGNKRVLLDFVKFVDFIQSQENHCLRKFIISKEASLIIGKHLFLYVWTFWVAKNSVASYLNTEHVD